MKPFSTGTILLLRQGYTDFAWFADLRTTGVFVVTRLSAKPIAR